MQSRLRSGDIWIILRLHVNPVCDTQNEGSCHAVRASNPCSVATEDGEDSLPQMDHELVGRLEQPPKELASYLEFFRPVVGGCVRVEVLMEHSAPFSPAVTVTHEHEVPVAADPG